VQPSDKFIHWQCNGVDADCRPCQDILNTISLEFVLYAPTLQTALEQRNCLQVNTMSQATNYSHWSLLILNPPTSPSHINGLHKK